MSASPDVATSMGSRTGCCRAGAPARGTEPCHLSLQHPAQQGSDPRGMSTDPEDDTRGSPACPRLCAGRRALRALGQAGGSTAGLLGTRMDEPSLRR